MLLDDLATGSTCFFKSVFEEIPQEMTMSTLVQTLLFAKRIASDKNYIQLQEPIVMNEVLPDAIATYTNRRTPSTPVL